jgi:hypothetical protein
MTDTVEFDSAIATRGVQPDSGAVQIAVLAPNSPMGMMMAAVKQGIPLDQIKEMMAIQREWEADEARKAFNEAFAAFKAEAVEVIKRKQVDFATQKGRTQYKHAELSDVVEAVGPALSRHGFSWSWTPEQKTGRIFITCTLLHRLGHEKSVSLDAPPDESGGKNTIQAIISTTTYLERHTLKAVCGISEKGDDNDGEGDGTYRNALLDEWSAKLDGAQTESELRTISREGQKIFSSKRDQVGFKDFSAMVIARAAAIQGAQNA